MYKFLVKERLQCHLRLVFKTLSYPAAGAGLTGTKMARRIGDLDEFEFKAIGENHNQGVSAYFPLLLDHCNIVLRFGV